MTYQTSTRAWAALKSFHLPGHAHIQPYDLLVRLAKELAAFNDTYNTAQFKLDTHMRVS